MSRRRIPARVGVVTASAVFVAAGGVVAMGVLAPAPRPAAAQAVELPGQSDHCYVEGMLVHHAQALALSERVLDADGVSDRVRALAEFIVADQSAEMTTMTAWSAAWAEAATVAAADADATSAGGHAGHATSAGVDPGSPASDDAHAGHAASSGASPSPVCTRDIHAAMSGMASAEQLAALAGADGAPAQRLFLELMIVHHEGALVMAREALTEGANAFVRSSAKHVLVEQEREIDAMTALLVETP